MFLCTREIWHFTYHKQQSNKNISWIKGETIHRMYRNHNYFWGRFDSRYVEAAYDTNDMMLIF
jgi:Ni/Co efflux regulator RcnB